jgi:tRNA nucleotidyltransferase (CCA-adding enzyme)
MAAQLAPGDAVIGFAALTHDLGKALTPHDVLPRHIGHESAGLAPLRALCERLKVPQAHRQLATLVCREHLNIHRLFELRAVTVHDLLARCDGFRQPARIAQLGLACEADKRGRAGLADSPYPQRAELSRLLDAALSVRAVDVARAGLEGPALGEALRRARIHAIEQARAQAPGTGA